MPYAREKFSPLETLAIGCAISFAATIQAYVEAKNGFNLGLQP
jgi:hypothetical protein